MRDESGGEMVATHNETEVQMFEEQLKEDTQKFTTLIDEKLRGNIARET